MSRVILLVPLLAAACATGPSFESYLGAVKERAGSGAVDCGVVPLGHPRDEALSCASTMLREGRPFWVVVQVMGIDSEVYVGLAVGSEGQAWETLWDSGGVGRRAMQMSRCEVPRIVDVPGELPFQCRD